MIPRARVHHSIRCVLFGLGTVCLPAGAETNTLAVQNAPLESHYWPRHISPYASVREQWGALVVSEEDYWVTRGANEAERRSKVTVGVTLNAETPFNAELAALGECQRNGAKECRIVAYFTQCGFITNGVHIVHEDRYKYTHGHSAEEVKRVCESDGYRCDAPIGGCNDNAK